MKTLKVLFAAFFVLFSLGIMNAQGGVQWPEEDVPSCISGENFGMEILASYSPSSGICCFEVTVNYFQPFNPKKPAVSNDIFISYPGYMAIYSTPSFSTQVCFPVGTPDLEIRCGVASPTGSTLCYDGCTVIIEPCKVGGGN